LPVPGEGFVVLFVQLAGRVIGDVQDANVGVGGMRQCDCEQQEGAKHRCQGPVVAVATGAYVEPGRKSAFPMSPIIAVNVGSSSVRLAAYREDGVCIESARHTGKHSAAELLASFARSLDKPVAAVAHRVVHGGDRFVEPCRIDGPMLEELE